MVAFAELEIFDKFGVHRTDLKVILLCPRIESYIEKCSEFVGVVVDEKMRKN